LGQASALRFADKVETRIAGPEGPSFNSHDREVVVRIEND